MELSDALEKANQILDEERSSPTVDYDAASRPDSPDLLRGINDLAGTIMLNKLRQEHPRDVLEVPGKFRFVSINYMLICQLLSQLAEKDKQPFVAGVVRRMQEAPGCKKSSRRAYPFWHSLVSEFPLLGEFAVRNGGKSHLFRLLQEAALVPGHILLLIQLEDMIALNYSLFTDSEYERLSSSVRALGDRAELASRVPIAQPGLRGRWPEIGEFNVLLYCSDVLYFAKSIVEQCRKARYLYLKGQLLEGLNEEVNQDKTQVESYLVRFGFTKPLIDSLNEADRLYREQKSSFELKSSMGHLRSFMENLHSEVIPAICGRGVTAPSPGWGSGLAFLRKNAVLTEQEEKFVVGLYGLISDEAVHPLIAEKEYARLTRNMVIEYALLFLRKVEKLGLKKSVSATV